MAKITYANKVALNENANVDPINKVRDIDMNEIKQVVNQNDDNMGNLSSLETTIKTSIVNAINEVLSSIPSMSQIYGSSTKNGYCKDYINECLEYSENETDTGKRWIDGKPIYRKVIVINNPSGTVQHGISNLGTIISATGNATLANGLQEYIPRPLYNWTINIADFDDSSFNFQNDGNYTDGYAITTARVVLEYTKTTD